MYIVYYKLKSEILSIFATITGLSVISDSYSSRTISLRDESVNITTSLKMFNIYNCLMFLWE